MNSIWTLNNLAGVPQSVRPETHWLQDTTNQGRKDGRLWFSLQLTRERANELYRWDFAGSFGELIERGALMAPTSRMALRFALDREKPDPDWGTIGTDILVPPDAFAALELLATNGIVEIADAGLAIEGEIPKLLPASAEEMKSVTKPICGDGSVIIAIIDDGIGVANHRFRATAATTRVKHFLDLSLVGAPPKGGIDELLGRSWTGADIDALLARYPDDEEQVYRALGLIDTSRMLRQPLRAAATHGTHMLDTAAGYDWRTEKKETLASRPIIAVQVPTQVAENRSDAWMPQSLKRALDWILVKADELSAELSKHDTKSKARRLPLIVNGSFASMAGPQDGFSDIERRICQFVETYRNGGDARLCTVVLSGGNSLQLRAAAKLHVGPGKERASIPWRIQPDDRTPNFVEIWLEKVTNSTQPQQVEVSLTPPHEAPAHKLSSKLDQAVDWIIGKDVGARLYHQRWPRPDGSRQCITIATRSTADTGDGEPVVPAGVWSIEIKNLDAKEQVTLNLRVHRDDVGMFARSGARQSYFDDPKYNAFELPIGHPLSGGRLVTKRRRRGQPASPVTIYGTLNSYGYGNGSLLAAGYRRSDGEPAEYSSCGSNDMFRAGTDKDGPDLAAVTEESPSLPGILGAGTASGSVAILNGTSVAAPLAVRALADILAKDGGVSELIELVKTFEEHCRGPEGSYRKSSKLCFGAGRLPFKSSYRLRT
jgi:hypothetical protein